MFEMKCILLILGFFLAQQLIFGRLNIIELGIRVECVQNKKR